MAFSVLNFVKLKIFNIMMFDMKQARDSNTVSYWKETIWRMFIGEKLFISDHHQTCFDTKEELWNAFYNSTMWGEIRKYVDYSQKFFDKENDPDWRIDFEQKVLANLEIRVKEYKWNP